MSTLSDSRHPSIVVTPADSGPLSAPPSYSDDQTPRSKPIGGDSSYIEPPSYADVIFSPFDDNSEINGSDDGGSRHSHSSDSLSRSPSSLSSDYIKVTVSSPQKEKETTNHMVMVWFVEITGLVKILKKYDKRTGDLMRLPFIQKVLQQPFYTTDLLYKLIKESEAMLDRFFPVNETESEHIQAELSEHKFMESLHMKSTIAALRVLKEIRNGSSSVSVFSLPPLQLNGIKAQDGSCESFIRKIRRHQRDWKAQARKKKT